MMAQAETNFEPGTRDADLADGHEGEALLNKCCADLGVGEARAMEILEWAEENLTMQNAKCKMQNVAAGRLVAKLIRLLEWLNLHPNRIGMYAGYYSLNEPLVDDLIGHLCPADYAKTLRCSRQAVVKMVLKAQEFLELPPRKGQRNADARRNMSVKRDGQLVDPRPRILTAKNAENTNETKG